MRLAIVIEGEQNSGKTSTIKEFVMLFTGRKLKQMRRGWQHIFLNPSFRSIRFICYCLPASPSETGVKLGKHFKNSVPQVLVLAEQPSGINYSDTYNFLNNNGYTIIPFRILKSSGSLDWERFESSNKSTKLANRANDIADSIRNYINSNNLI
ncbi:hypothetical protein [Psychroserpens sp. SPM9]|uniref:hypothetical protein n=1 Tax=Psychroserpens sp. SPM9 TaxID=2975598 RepID=UPI0021A6FB15|nr:hypothetical protein [Psychroserpens sp. SPM9]MDG5490594.1 hypothetical protein [Psychroserpens sp. SPM9]